MDQGRFKSFAVQTDEPLLTVARYGERKAGRAKRVARAAEGQGSSLWRWVRHEPRLLEFLTEGPGERPHRWSQWGNEMERETERDDLRGSAQRGRPFGREDWGVRMARRLGLESALHPRGRPKRL